MTSPLKLFQAWLAITLLAGCPAAQAHKVYYTIPADLTRSPFNCTYSAGLYTCPSISLSHHTTLNVTTPVSIKVNGSFSTAQQFTTTGAKLTLDVTGSLAIGQQSSVNMDLDRVAGSATIGQQSSITGNLNVDGNLSIDQKSLVDGTVWVGGDLIVGNRSVITGNCTVIGNTAYKGCAAPPPTAKLDHILIEHAGTGVTCMASTITIKACSSADSGGTCTAFTDGMDGTILVTNGAGAEQEIDFSIPDGSSETTISLSSATADNLTLSAYSNHTCWNGTTDSCAFEFKQTAFAFADITNHVAGTQQDSTLSALATKVGSKSCEPAFTTTTPVTFFCSYNNPKQGSPLTLTFGGNPPQAFSCGSDTTISVPFDSSGKAAFKLNYPDVGNITLKAFVGSTISGQDSFIAVPASFRLTVAPTTVTAGQDFNVKVEAMTAQSNVAAKSFGLETPAESALLEHKRCQPSSDSPSDGILTATAAAFANGQAIYTASWNEVGSFDLTARLASGSYLGSGLTATGLLSPGASACAGADGALTSVPHHFSTALDPSRQVYTYSGQPLEITVSAHAKSGAVASNYYLLSDKSSKTVRPLTLGAWGGTVENPGGGKWNSNSVALADMQNGPAHGSIVFTRTYTLADKLTAPADGAIRANDTVATSSGYAEGKTNFRNGRLRLSNAFGSINQALYIPVMAQYWSGNSWILNADDNSTTLPTSSIALTHTGVSGSTPSLPAPFAAGQGTILLSKPTSGTAGTVDIAVNLDDDPVKDDNSCLSKHPDTTGNKQPWLRHTFGNCAAPADPSARATFGVYPGQTKRTIYVREAYN